MTGRVLAGLVVFCILVPVSFAGYAVLARWVLHGPVTPESLARSVVLEEDGMTSATCRRTSRPGTWRCSLYDSSTTRTVSVRVEPGSSCWESRRLVSAKPRRSVERSGCVHRWQWSLL